MTLTNSRWGVQAREFLAADCPGAFSDYDGQGCVRALCILCDRDAAAHDRDPLSSPSATTPDEPTPSLPQSKGQVQP